MSDVMINIHPQALRRFIRDAFLKVGLSQDDAITASDVLVTADEFGVATHGAKLLPGYLKRLQGGGARPQGRPRVINEGPAWAIVDGDSSLGVLIGVYSMQVAIDKAKSSGIAYVGVRNSGHFAAAGYYSLMAAKKGLIGISLANDTPSVVAPGAKRAVVGTNPCSFAVPACRHSPLLLDMAISTVAGGKVYQARMLGKTIPEDWIVGLDGLPTTKAELYPNEAFLVPFGGYKGFGLALLIETLAALLSGAEATYGVRSWMAVGADQPTMHGAAFLALDPNILGSGKVFLERVDNLIDEIHAAPTVADIDHVKVPGEREFDNQKKAQRESITLLPDVARNVRLAAEMVGLSIVDYLLEREAIKGTINERSAE